MNPFYLVLNPDNTISFNRPLAHAIGLSETIIYGALVAKWYYYSEREMLNDDGWFYSTVPDLQESTSLSEKQQKRCIKALVDLNLIKCETRGMPARRCFYLIDDFEKILSLIEMGKSISEEIKPAAYEKNQLKVMAREERKSTVESVENPIQTENEISSFSNSAFPFSAQSQKNPSNFSGENGSKCAETVEENRSQTAWLTSSAERSEQVLPKGQNKSRPKVGTSSAEKSEQVPPKGQNKFCQNDGTSSAQREDKSKYNQSKRKNLYMIERSTPAENSAEQFVENSEELAEKVRSSIGYYGIIDIVNIALHISLKNFEQQCNGINIHFATLRGYLFHCGRRFALLIRVISTSLLCRRHSANGRTYPAVIPIAHVVAPDHCFQLFYRVIRTSSAAAVKQLVLHSRPHTFAAGVVMTSASGAVHALLYSILVQRSSV